VCAQTHQSGRHVSKRVRCEVLLAGEQTRHVRVGFENRFGPLGRTTVQIAPTPLNKRGASKGAPLPMCGGSPQAPVPLVAAAPA
jgi:hypothetical protein